jgi:hypothetical protein
MTAQIISLRALDDTLERINSGIDDALIAADMGDFDTAMDRIEEIRAIRIADNAPAMFLRKVIDDACDGLLHHFARSAGILTDADCCVGDGKEPA